MSSRPKPLLVAGAVGLDFLNSIATPVDVPVEWIACGDDLLAWMQSVHLIPRREAAVLRRSTSPRKLDAIAAQARVLREWFRSFVRGHMGSPLDRRALTELAPLNQLLATERGVSQIVAREGGLRLDKQREWSQETLLSCIAEALADVVCNDDFALIKACEGPLCSLIYLDRTRARGRRWCSMAVCGNRSKQAANRARKSPKPKSERRR